MYVEKTHCKVREIRRSDPDFLLTDGIMQWPRADLHILSGCPANVAEMIRWAVIHGYLETRAYVKESELVWERLQS